MKKFLNFRNRRKEHYWSLFYLTLFKFKFLETFRFEFINKIKFKNEKLESIDRGGEGKEKKGDAKKPQY